MPSFMTEKVMPLSDAVEGYKLFNDMKAQKGKDASLVDRRPLHRLPGHDSDIQGIIMRLTREHLVKRQGALDVLGELDRERVGA